MACRPPVQRGRGRDRPGRSRPGRRQDRPGQALAAGAPAGTKEETPAGTRGETPAVGAVTVPRVATTHEEVPVGDRVPLAPTTPGVATGTAPGPPAPATDAPGRARLVPPGLARAAVAALGLTAAPGRPTAARRAGTGRSEVSEARHMAVATASAPPGLFAATGGRVASNPRLGSPGPAGRCRPDGGASRATAPGTSRRAAPRHRKSGPRRAASRAVARPGPRWQRTSGLSGRPGPASRRGRALSAPAMPF